MKDLKNKCVDAEALLRFLLETTLTPEVKIVALVAALNGGNLTRQESPQGRGRADFDRARAQLREKRLAKAPMRQPHVLELNPAPLFKGLEAKEHKNVAAKPDKPKPKPAPKPSRAPEAPGSGGPAGE